MKIGIVGTGNLGTGLARRLWLAGNEVFVGSRDALRGKAIGSHIATSGGGYRRAAEYGPVVVLAVPWLSMDATLNELGGLRGKIVIDPTNPFVDEECTKLEPLEGTSCAEEIQRATGAKVVKCFNHLYAELIHFSGDVGGRAPAVFLCGDDGGAKATVRALAASIGFDPVDAGPLQKARFLEALAGLMAGLAHEQRMGTRRALALLHP